MLLDVREVTVLADYFVITGGDSPSQVKAIVEAVDAKLEPLGCKALGIEGKSESRWVLLDYGDVIVHVLHEKERGYYKLEQFWNQALVVDRSEWEKQE
ncbi:MAG TPA: ribosome silencing factor [Candidatus Melainabacteria bacterium]|nr:ribosome silencing factor [Candidatus Melainabacteria bacterium]